MTKGTRAVGLLVASAISAGPCVAPAQVGRIRVAVHSVCPDGVSGCWPYIREGLERVPGVHADEACEFLTWMATVHLDSGRLPPLDSIGKSVKEAGQPFSIRGIEVTLRGTIMHRGDQWLIKTPGLDGFVRLSAASRDLEWDPHKNVGRQLSVQQRGAFDRLRTAARSGLPFNCEVTGWLSQVGQTSSIEVVAFK